MLEAVERHMWHHLQTYAFGECFKVLPLPSEVTGTNSNPMPKTTHFNDPELQAPRTDICKVD